MKYIFVLILAIFIGAAVWGCPNRKIVPDPLPPQPQVYEGLHSLDAQTYQFT